VALVARPYAGFNYAGTPAAPQAALSYVYDDALTPPRITTLTATNAGAAGTLYVTVTDPATGAPVPGWDRRPFAVGSGTTATDVTARDWRLVDRVARDGTTHFWALPVAVAVGWGSA
jgi:hypothetical protein